MGHSSCCSPWNLPSQIFRPFQWSFPLGWSPEMRRAHLWSPVKAELCIFRDGPSVTAVKWQGVTMQTLGRQGAAVAAPVSPSVTCGHGAVPWSVPPPQPSCTNVLHRESLSRFQPKGHRKQACCESTLGCFWSSLLPSVPETLTQSSIPILPYGTGRKRGYSIRKSSLRFCVLGCGASLSWALKCE